MLGRTSARVLRSTPRHICPPCLRRQLLRSVTAPSSSLATLRPTLLHTTAAVQDQAQAESPNPPSNAASPSAPELKEPEPSTDIAAEVDKSPKTPGRKKKKRAKANVDKNKSKKSKQDSHDLDQEKDQNSREESFKAFVAGQLENHTTLSEALLHGSEKTELEKDEHASPTLLRKVVAKDNGSVVRRISGNREGEDSEKKSAGGRKKRKPRKGSTPNDKRVEDNGNREKQKKPKTIKGGVTAEEEESHRTDLAKASGHESLSAQELDLTPLDVDQPPVPSLAYGLDRVLFNPGVYQLQDPRTQVFNFDPYLSNIMPVAEFNFNSLGEYITSSRDTALSDLAREHQKTFVGSTSSMTASLSHFHYLLSCWRPINMSLLSKDFPEKLNNFTRLNRLPASVFLRYKNGVYSIDADKEFDQSNILAMLGKSMEKLLTLPTEEYERYRVSNPNQISEEERRQPESYHYTSMGDILMRSQLDAHDSRLPGTGMYDLKTRAVVSIRMDVHEWDKNTGYQIKNNLGQFESYEREYHDMMRSVFLKYSLQARMGRMDGIFVAYHNIERIFGFQYMSLEDMDRAIHGTTDGGREVGDQEFRLSIGLLNRILRQATERFPETSLRIQFETRESQASPWMYIFAEPMTEDQIQAIQDTNKAQVQAFERRVLGIDSEDSTEGDALEGALTKEAREYDEGASDDVVEDDATETTVTEGIEGIHEAHPAASEENVAFEQEIAKDEAASDDAASERATTAPDVGEGTAPEITEAATRGELPPVEDSHPGVASVDEASADNMAPHLGGENQVIQENARHEAAAEEDNGNDHGASNEADHPLLALKLFVTNKVDGEPVLRPKNLSEDSDWTIDYTIKEVENSEKAMALLKACRKRRAQGFSHSVQDVKGDKVLSYYQRMLVMQQPSRRDLWTWTCTCRGFTAKEQKAAVIEKSRLVYDCRSKTLLTLTH
ncbi:PET127-like protein [Phyllosticta capitalensis]|uniref:PET127-like protein n=1 Tax=Phyllosticta capitalensis TaxID=121624 RepID=A0ABR1Z2T7_9PEZI